MSASTRDGGDDVVDVGVIGGWATGQTTAAGLGRSRRTALVPDAGEPRNPPANGVPNSVTRDGTPPSELLSAGRAEVARVGGRVRTGRAVGIGRPAARSEGAVHQGAEVRVRWDRNERHCPSCHGWEVRDQAIGVTGSGPMAVHQRMLFRQWTGGRWADDLTLLVHTAPPLIDGKAEQLTARNVPVVSEPVAAFEARRVGADRRAP